ncbi:hypothetical protein K438DRAFT_1966070 [Mycena galopus ATCC 62051]|nr:hypothetical protein K438DRAFT_1966070 [Mycena galopus ATCC 62051]
MLFTVPLFAGTLYTTVILSTSHTHTIRTAACSNEDAVHAAALGENGRPPADEPTPSSDPCFKDLVMGILRTLSPVGIDVISLWSSATEWMCSAITTGREGPGL